MTSYLIRMDDIHPNMNYDRFNTFCQLLDKYNIKPILGVIPNNKDKSLNIGEYIKDFFLKIKKLQENGYIVSLHGYEHKYSKKESGIMGINQYSEFAGLSYEEQNNKITKGLEILNSNGIKTDMFMAPAHSFDQNTINALVANGITMITDGFYLYPYFKEGIWYIPQQFWNYREIKFSGLFTFCFHLDTFSDDEFNKFLKNSERFILNNQLQFNNFNNFNLTKYKSFKYKIINIVFNAFYQILYKLKHILRS